MPNHAALLRSEIEAAHPGAVLQKQKENSFVYAHSDGRREHCYTPGPIHWHAHKDDPWEDIDTDVEDHPDGGGHVKSARFDTIVGKDGARRFVPRRWLPDEYVEFGPLQWKAAVKWTTVPLGAHAKVGSKHRFERATHDYEIGFNEIGCRTNFTVKSKAFARPLRWAVTLVGLSWRDGVLVSDSDGEEVGFIRPPFWTDSSDSPIPR